MGAYKLRYNIYEAHDRIKELETENELLRAGLLYIHEIENEASSALSFGNKQSCQDSLCCIASKIRKLTTLNATKLEGEL